MSRLYVQSFPTRIRSMELAIGFLMSVALIAPRGTYVYLALLAIALAAFVARCGAGVTDDRQLGLGQSLRAMAMTGAVVAPAAFLFYATLSAVWADLPVDALLEVGGLILVTAATTVAIGAVGRLDTEASWCLARGALHGVVIGVVYMAIEFATFGALKAFVTNEFGINPIKASFNVVKDGRVAWIEPTFLNRHALVLSLLVWPALGCLCVWLVRARTSMMFIAPVLLVAIATVLMLSESEMAKLAVVVGAITLAIAYLNARWTLNALCAAWLAATLCVIPLVRFGLPLDAPYVQHIQLTGRDRIAIWQHTIKRTWAAPIFGVGAAMTPHLHDREKDKVPRPMDPRLSRHAHNTFVQVWFELGLIGAMLLAAAGGFLIAAARNLHARVQPFAAALVSAVMITALVGPSLWGLWPAAGAGLAVVLLALSSRANRLLTAAP